MVNIPQGNGNSNRFEVLNEGNNKSVALKSTHESPLIAQLNSDANNSSDGFVVVTRRVHAHRKRSEERRVGKECRSRVSPDH